MADDKKVRLCGTTRIDYPEDECIDFTCDQPEDHAPPHKDTFMEREWTDDDD